MTETTETAQIAVQQPRNELRLSGPRLPYHPLIEERFGIDRGTWKFLTDVLYPSAEEPETIINVLAYCKARKLDVLKKPVHVVPVWDKRRSKMVDSVWPSIAEVRITATRTGLYAGRDETVFGPDKTETLGGVEVTYPEWAQVTVYRFVAGQACAFVGEKVRWKEYYAKAKRDTLAPNDMWKTKTYSQIAKCAEANALRCAFPEEDGGPTAEEMDGQEVESLARPEPVLGSGVRARLEQTKDKPTDGFNAAALEALVDDAAAEVEPEAATEAPHDPETGEVIDAKIEPIKEGPQPPKARDEINGPAPRDVLYMLAGDPVSDAGRVPTYKNGTKFSTCGAKGAADLARYTMHPTQAETPPAEDGETFPVDLPSKTEASTANDQTVSQDGPDADEDDGEWWPLEQNAGPAPRGVEYTLADEEIGSDECAQAYIDGEPSRRVDFEAFKELPEYEAHPDPIAAAEPEPEVDDRLVELRPLQNWNDVKKKLPAVYQQMSADKLSWDDQEAVRRQIVAEILAPLQAAGQDIDPAKDPSAFHLFRATQSGPEGADNIEDVFADLEKTDAFQGMSEQQQGRLRELKESTVKALRAF